MIVEQAMTRLRAFAESEVRRSSLWRTSPVDCPPESSDFINAAAAFVACGGLTPEGLLQGLKALEVEFGRVATAERNAARELDLDLLLFDDQTRDEADFVLPHPRAADRLFVLAPAAEVLPGAVWPGKGLTVRQLLSEVASDEQAYRLSHARSQ